MTDKLKVIFLGDVVGRPGRDIIRENIDYLKDRYNYDFLVINGENSAGGAGIVPKTADDLFSIGADVITLGDHCFDEESIFPYFADHYNLIRPDNIKNKNIGKGWAILDFLDFKIAVVNLIGRVFISGDFDCPFERADELLEKQLKDIKIIIVDFHSEATSEKVALSKYLSGRVSLVLGTHTHIPTADERIEKNFTGCISDVGMCGSYANVIGMDYETALARFKGEKKSYKLGKGDEHLAGIFAVLDKNTGRCEKIERIWK